MLHTLQCADYQPARQHSAHYVHVVRDDVSGGSCKPLVPAGAMANRYIGLLRHITGVMNQWCDGGTCLTGHLVRHLRHDGSMAEACAGDEADPTRGAPYV